MTTVSKGRHYGNPWFVSLLTFFAATTMAVRPSQWMQTPRTPRTVVRQQVLNGCTMQARGLIDVCCFLYSGQCSHQIHVANAKRNKSSLVTAAAERWDVVLQLIR